MDLTRFLVQARTASLPDREVIDALVHPAHTGPSPELERALATWRGPHYWSTEPDGRHLILTWVRARRPERWWLHGALFLLTFFSVTVSGAVLAGRLPYHGILGFVASLAHAGPGFWTAWASGLTFSVPLLAILLAHELGHYVTARRHGVNASPPFFIPAPVVSVIGTLGAFIRIRTILTDRRQLIDIGVAGPFAGFVVALPVLVLGLTRSVSHPLAAPGAGMLLRVGPDVIPIGGSLLTDGIRALVLGGSGGIVLHPLAFAGWIGMFVTMLNLLPLAQLDGGHALYAALPRLQGRLALVFWVALAVLGWYTWPGWIFWAVFVVVLSRGRLAHPPVLDEGRALPPSRRWMALAALLLFVLTFVPRPF